MAIITVIGAGMMGSAIIFPAAENHHTIRIVGTPLDRDIIEHARQTGEHLTLKRRMPEGITYYQYEQFSEALEGCDLLVSGVSSFGVDWFLQEIIGRIPESLPVLSVTKGMIHDGGGALISYPELYERSTPKKIAFMAVGGPCTSYELADHDYSAVTFCGRDIALLRKIRAWFETDYYHVSLSTDVRGVECAVAMKNAYALGVALAEKYNALAVEPEKQVVGIAHADCPEDAERLASLLRTQRPPKDILTVCYEPVTGSHVGPGALALFFLGDQDVRDKA